MASIIRGGYEYKDIRQSSGGSQPASSSEPRSIQAVSDAEMGALIRDLRGLCANGDDASRDKESKFDVLKRNWGAVRNLVTTGDVCADIQALELHISENCQLTCSFCRDGLRDVPAAEETIAPADLFGALQPILIVSPQLTVRISGTIGDPLTHPQIGAILSGLNARGIRYGVTTNGISLSKPGIADDLLMAKYVHVSIDAGSDETYQRLKGGPSGSYTRVLHNLDSFLRKRVLAGSSVQVIVSYLLQSENYRELTGFARVVESMGIDVLEVKMQHYDQRRIMRDHEVGEAYDMVRAARESIRGTRLRILELQDRKRALVKIQPSFGPSFRRCYANLLGLNATLDARGQLQTCCQYYQPTLGPQGHIKNGLLVEWRGSRRREVLMGDPRLRCGSCSPSDEHINQLVEVVRRMYERHPDGLALAEEIIFGVSSSVAEAT